MPLERLWMLKARLWAASARLEDALGMLLKRLGTPLGRLDDVLGWFWNVLGRLWDFFGTCWDAFGTPWARLWAASGRHCHKGPQKGRKNDPKSAKLRYCRSFFEGRFFPNPLSGRPRVGPEGVRGEPPKRIPPLPGPQK